MSQLGITISSSRSTSSSFSFPLLNFFVLSLGLVSNILELIAFLLGMETIVEIVGLAAKIDTALIELAIQIPEVSKTDVSKTVEEGRTYSSVVEVLVTSINIV